VTINWSITNNSNATQPVNFFAYADSDIGASAGNDDGSYTAGGGVNYYRNNDGTSLTANFFTMGADLRLNDRWQIGAFSGSDSASPRGALSNTLLSNLSNADTIGAAGDNAGALQWISEIAAGGSVGGRVTKGYNYLVPTPGAAALFGLSALAMGRRRRQA
jgi:hypothetical protein